MPAISLNYPVGNDNHTLSKINENSLIIQNTINNNMLLQENKTVYVAPTGSDTTGDGTSSKPYATINKALSLIPKNLNGFLAYVSITSGTYEGATFSGFHGGEITLLIDSGTTVNLTSQLTISRCNNFAIRGNGGTANLNINVSSGYCLYAQYSSIVLPSVSITAQRSGGTAILFDSLTGMTIYTTLTINNSTVALHCGGKSSVYISALQGSGNSTGINGQQGSSISYGSKTISATTEKTLSGGAIITNLLTMA